MNHARRLAEDDWDGMDAKEEKEDDHADGDVEEMEVELKKLPKYYANQVCVGGYRSLAQGYG